MKNAYVMILAGLLSNLGIASAATFLIDDFTAVQGPFMTVSDSVPINSGLMTSTSEGWIDRRLRLQHYGGIVSHGVETAGIGSGSFSISTNTNLYTGTNVIWRLPQIQGFNGATGGRLDLRFDTFNFNPIQLPSFSVSLEDFNPFLLPAEYLVPSTEPYLISYSLTNAQLAGITTGGKVLNLSFYGHGLNLSLDSVSLSTDPLVSAVPEPSEWAMMLGGLGIVALVARRKRSSKAKS
jgi:hypothetical protein